eukprot:symbB.v1.2.007556.t1/scaffold432.1/size246310/6
MPSLDVPSVAQLVTFSVLCLYHMRRWSNIIVLCRGFNDATCSVYATTFLPLMIGAQREISNLSKRAVENTQRYLAESKSTFEAEKIWMKSSKFEQLNADQKRLPRKLLRQLALQGELSEPEKLYRKRSAWPSLEGLKMLDQPHIIEIHSTYQRFTSTRCLLRCMPRPRSIGALVCSMVERERMMLVTDPGQSKPEGWTRFVCFSDTHGMHHKIPPEHQPEADVLLHAGDFTNSGELSQVKSFAQWLKEYPVKEKVVIAGNHDLSFDEDYCKTRLKKTSMCIEAKTILQGTSDRQQVDGGRNQCRLLPRKEPKKKEHFFSAYGFSEADITKMAESQQTKEHLLTLLEKGVHDWDSVLIEESHLGLLRDIRNSREKMRAVKAVVTQVQENDRLGEMYGNREMLQATRSYYLLGNEVPEDLESFRSEIQSLQNLEKTLGLFDPHSSAGYEACLKTPLPNNISLKSQAALCQCSEFWSCGDRPDGGDPFLVRVSLGSLDPPDGPTHLGKDASVELTELTPLRGVRILELGGGKIFNKDVMPRLWKVFPNVRVLILSLKAQEDLVFPSLGPWTSSIVALHLHAPMTSAVTEMFCQLQKLRFVTFGSAETDPGLGGLHINALPECMGDLKELIHLEVIGCNLTGSKSLPESLGKLKQLKLFEAFEQGRLSGEDELSCPGDWVPDRRDCVPGYVARVDHSDSPVWRCPVHGWNLRLDDMTLPWWAWESIEKMHIDANFIHGNIPETLPQYWPKLRSLDLHDMKLTGPLPMSLVSLENLTQLQVQLNDLHCPEGGDVIQRLMAKKKMRVLNLDANPRMCGCLPSEAPPFLHLQVGETSVEVGCDKRPQRREL